MKNALIYFYNMNVESIHQKDNNYIFSFNNKNYVLQLYELPLDESYTIYLLNVEMLKKNIKCHKIILTKFSNVVMSINNKCYILLEIQLLNNRLINLDDIINFKFRVNDTKSLMKLNKSSWGVLWENKIDYFEYQFSQIENKYPLIKKSINYYIGLCENAISYYNGINNIKSILYVSHRRVRLTDDLFYFFNPLNFIIDYRERDMAEYIKSFILEKSNNFELLLPIIKLFDNSEESIMLFITRLLFPSMYFDLYEKICIDKLDESTINRVIDKNKDIEIFLSKLFRYYTNNNKNIILIRWLLNN